MRTAIVYDCLFPHTVGGAERWYRRLADSLAAENSVTYVTRHQWDGEAAIDDFDVAAVSPGGDLYAKSGRRLILPPLLFGLGVFWHLLRKPRHYDVIECCSFPFFSCLGARLALKLRRSNTKLVVDWFEFWTREYWIEYLGGVGGRIGYAIQRLTLRASPAVITYSKLVESRILGEGVDRPLLRVEGLYPGSSIEAAPGSAGSPATVVFAGRQIPEKRVTAIPAAIAAARKQIPDLRCTIFGDGPDHAKLRAEIERLGLEVAISCPGFVDAASVERAMRSALCLLLPSQREGYGLVVVEAAGVGTPVVVTAATDNAAVELVDQAVNGFVADSADAGDLAAAIVEVHRRGAALRKSTAEWFAANATRLSMETSIGKVEEFLTRI